jgi:thiol-disulfide isomerase/thioredoxin
MTRLLTIVFICLLCSSFISREPRRALPPAPHLTTPPAAATTPPAAAEIIKQACAEAAASNKKVMVLFHASWCGWCHKLDTFMASPACKPLFDQSFVVCHLTVAESPDKLDLENPGAEELYDKYADKNSGIPFFLILTPDGAVIADSRIKPVGAKPGSSGDNIGYPASKEEVTYFLRVLHETTTLTGNQLKIIREKLSKT